MLLQNTLGFLLYHRICFLDKNNENSSSSSTDLIFASKLGFVDLSIWCSCTVIWQKPLPHLLKGWPDIYHIFPLKYTPLYYDECPLTHLESGIDCSGCLNGHHKTCYNIYFVICVRNWYNAVICPLWNIALLVKWTLRIFFSGVFRVDKISYKLFWPPLNTHFWREEGCRAFIGKYTRILLNGMSEVVHTTKLCRHTWLQEQSLVVINIIPW